MSNKIYRTALGKSVDMGALLLKNEDVRAVGNMGVNARGDVIGKPNIKDTTNPSSVNDHYRKQIRNQIIDVPVKNPITQESPTLDEVIEGLDDSDTQYNTVADNEPTVTVTTTETETKSKKKTGGLASAIAKAREVEQKKTETPREKSRGKKGVKKI